MNRPFRMTIGWWGRFREDGGLKTPAVPAAGKRYVKVLIDRAAFISIRESE